MLNSPSALIVVIRMTCIALALGACQTNREGQSVGKSELEEQLENITFESITDSRNMALWSPEQRKMNAGYFYLLSDYLSMKGEHSDQAFDLLEKAYNLDPNPFLASKLISMKANQSNLADALLDAKRMVLLYPQDANLRTILGSILLRLRQFDQAIGHLERSISIAPDSEGTYLLLSYAYAAMEDDKKSISVLKDLVRHNPGSFAGWLTLAKHYLITKQHKDALHAAKQAYELNGRDPMVLQIYALSLYVNERFSEAIGYYEELHRLSPNDPELMAQIIAVYRELGDLKEALALIDDLLNESSNKNAVGLQLQKAMILWEVERFKESTEILRVLKKEHPQSERITYLLAIGEQKGGNFPQALKLLEELDQSDVFGNMALVQRILILQEAKKIDEALALGEEALQRSHVGWEVYYIYADILASQKKYTKAIEVLHQGLTQYSDEIKLLFMRGVIEEKSGDHNGVIATMRTIIKKDPQNSSAYNFLGYVFAEAGENLDEAQKLIEEALRLKPEDGYYLDSLGWVYFQKKDYEKALSYLERALAKVPDEGVILEHLGDVHLALGQKNKALTYYRKALKAQIEDRERQRITEKLADLEQQADNTENRKHK